MSKHSSLDPENNENELPFLEINDDAPEEWVMSENSSPTTPNTPNTHTASPFDAPIIELRPRHSNTPRPSLIQHSQFKVIAITGGVLLTLMVLFRIPPILIFIGVFSVLRVFFIPLALIGFVWWVTRLYYPRRR